MIIDGKNLIMGRVCTVAAKKALLGEKVDIVNCEHIIITGNRAHILSEYKRRKDMGTYVGPHLNRVPDRFVRRTVRGMLPYKQPRGMAALKRVMCYRGVPEGFKDKKMETLPEANVSKMANLKYVTVGDVCKHLGGKV